MLTLIDRLSLLAAIVAATLLGIAIILVCQMVYLRYILGASAPWQTEAVTVSLVAATLLGSAYVLKERGHVAVGLVVQPDAVILLDHPKRGRGDCGSGAEQMGADDLDQHLSADRRILPAPRRGNPDDRPDLAADCTGGGV